MTEQELYNYYYNYFTRDIDATFNTRYWRPYVGATSKEADKLVSELPKDQQSRDVIKRAAEDALKSKGYDQKNSHVWGAGTPEQSKFGRTAALAAITKLSKDKSKPTRTALVDPNALQQDPNQLALNIINAMQAGQPIDAYIAMVPEGADDLYKSAFIYTLASNYPAKTPEVSKEMQALAERHRLKAQQWSVSRQSKLGMNDLLTLGGYANKQTVKRGKD